MRVVAIVFDILAEVAFPVQAARRVLRDLDAGFEVSLGSVCKRSIVSGYCETSFTKVAARGLA